MRPGSAALPGAITDSTSSSPRPGRHRIAADAEDARRPGVLPFVDDPLHQVGVGTAGHTPGRSRRRRARSGRRPPARCRGPAPAGTLDHRLLVEEDALQRRVGHQQCREQRPLTAGDVDQAAHPGQVAGGDHRGVGDRRHAGHRGVELRRLLGTRGHPFEEPVCSRVSTAVLPVRTHSPTSDQICQCQGSPWKSAQSRTESGSPAQSGRASRVISKRPSRRSEKMPAGVSTRSSRRSASALQPVEAASSSAVRGPWRSWSAIAQPGDGEDADGGCRSRRASGSASVTGGGRRRLRSRPSPDAALCMPAASAGGGVRGVPAACAHS